METFIISVLISSIVTYTLMHYQIYKVNELYKKYMDFEKSSVEEFAKSITSRLPKNSSKRGRQEINHIAADPFISLYIEPDVRIY